MAFEKMAIGIIIQIKNGSRGVRNKAQKLAVVISHQHHRSRKGINGRSGYNPAFEGEAVAKLSRLYASPIRQCEVFGDKPLAPDPAFGKQMQTIPVPEKGFGVQSVTCKRGRKAKMNGIDLATAWPYPVDAQILPLAAVVAKITNINVALIIGGDVFPVGVTQPGQI